MTTKRKHRNTFGTAEQLPSGRWRAFYRYEGNRFISPTTYTTKSEAIAWLVGLALLLDSVDFGITVAKIPSRIQFRNLHLAIVL